MILQVTPLSGAYNGLGEQTFANLKTWVDEVRTQREQDVTIALVGCKSDLADQRYSINQMNFKFIE